MNERWDTPETVVQVQRVTKSGDTEDYQDVVAGLELSDKSTLRIDLRNMRPMRVLDREGVMIDIYLADVLRAIAVGVENKVKDE